MQIGILRKAFLDVLVTFLVSGALVLDTDFIIIRCFRVDKNKYILANM